MDGKLPALDVAVASSGADGYPHLAPYHPDTAYPEYPFAGAVGTELNGAYRAARECLRLLGYDHENFNTAQWNPLGHLIQPGMRVVLKPNFVLSRHSHGGDLWSIVTHPAMLRVVADYCWIALRGEGSIEIADAPQYNCDFEELMTASKLRETAAFITTQGGVPCAVTDLRNYWSPRRHHHSHLIPLPGDPRGKLIVDLGARSALVDKSSKHFYGAVYHRQETIRHHSGARHEYEVSKTHYDADVFISVPKLKVHKKVGVTLNAKGMVGTATNKNYLVHYSLRTPIEGGDQFPDGWLTEWEKIGIRAERWMYDTLLARRNNLADSVHRSLYWLHGKTLTRMGLAIPGFKRILDAGNWYGNDSAWRMTLDLLRAIFFADRNGVLHDKPVRRMFSFVDGIVGGENQGPLDPDANHSHVVLAGEHFLAVDLVATRLMGFDYRRLKMYTQALSDPYFDFGIRNPAEIPIHATDNNWTACMADTTSRYLDYLPHPGWIGYLETDSHPEKDVDFFRSVAASVARARAMHAMGK